jgi:ATP-dependent Clp protease ATP-binding subunit ClpB
LQEAQRIAQSYSHQEMDGEHLLLALINQSESLIPDLLEKTEAPSARLKPGLESELERHYKVQGGSEAYLGSQLKAALDSHHITNPE